MSGITWTDIKSSNIKSIAHYNGHLFVKFNAGTVYRYENVPPETYTKLTESESKGRFLTTDIKGKFKFEKIADVVDIT